MTGPIIRCAINDDLSSLLDLYRHLYPDDPVLDLASASAAWSALLSLSMTTVIVADSDGLLTSSCTLAVVPNLTRSARPYGVIENVVTHPDYRRQGLGRAVLQTALGIAWKADCYRVSLATGSRRETTLQFYEDAGFQRGKKTYFQVRRP